VRVERFVDEYSLVAPLYGVTPDELMRRDEQQGQVLQGWYAVNGGQAVGAAVAWLRPDDRMFLMFRVEDVRASTWGYPSFTMATSPSNKHTHPRLSRIAAEQLGIFHQLIRPYHAFCATSRRRR
jgi:hypothetical protein